MKDHISRMIRKTTALTLCIAMVLTSVVFAVADDSQWSWNYPTSAVSVTNSDGTRNVTVTCTNAGANIGEILGADQPAGGMYGRYDGGIKLWTTDANENPDRYLSNLAYLWCKYNEEPASTKSTFPAEQTELSSHEYTLNPVGGTATGQYGRTLAGSGPNTVNKTAVAEYGGIPTVLYSRADIICGSTVANYEEYLELMHSDEWKNSEYYVEGDENYNPIFVEIGTGTITQRANAFKDVAKAMNEVIDNSDGKIVARYGDPEVIANDMEKVIYGTYFSIKELIDNGDIQKKKATWIGAKDTTNNTYNCTYYNMEICYEFFGDIFEGPADSYEGNSSLDTIKYTIDELADMDFILCGRNQKKNLLTDFANAGYTKDQIPLLMEDMNHTGFDAGWGMGGASTTWALAYPYSWVYAYYDELSSLDSAINPTAMYRYIQEKFCHITKDSSASVAAASMANMWNVQTDLDTVPDKTDYEYDSIGIENFIVDGINYALDNEETIYGAYECWWDPFYQCTSYSDYIENYTNVEKKGCFVSAGVLPEGTDLSGYYERTGGDSVDTYTYKAAEGKADGTTKYYQNYVTEEMFNAYKAGEAEQVWDPDLSGGIGSTPEEQPVPVADRVTTSAADGGSVAISPETVKTGDTVTLTVTAKDGYTVDGVKVLDAEGNEVSVTAGENGEYTFTLPEGNVTVTPSFKEEEKPEPEKKNFIDVATTAWYYDAVQFVASNGYFYGTSDTEFSPELTMTRAMTVTVLYRMAGSPEVSGLSAFKDVASDAYYAKAVKWAADQKITNGTTAETFSPDDAVTRQQFAKFAYIYLKSSGKDVSKTTSLNAFKDAGDVAEYAETPMKWAVAQGVIKGVTTDTLDPTGTATRAQVATILMRVAGL